MTEYFDIRCGDDMDPFGRDAAPLEVFAQDIYHLLKTNKLTLLRDPDWGLGLESYLSKPLPSTLASDVESMVMRDDRAAKAKCTITPVAGKTDSYRLDLQVECDAGFLEMALSLTPSGIVRVS
ncbi:MAG: hypothetical protein KF764_08610 [Labilithrix sp.]|nr:hypothetical protein [Labilithrix sp.]